MTHQVNQAIKNQMPKQTQAETHSQTIKTNHINPTNEKAKSKETPKKYDKKNLTIHTKNAREQAEGITKADSALPDNCEPQAQAH
ncbi:hypothetical protein [Escherichia coli]|uniref:hypothetical protein n=1 Tax=Escherichia coli TaxID=562 RepID=UPI0006524575|nr:hypothetical protein [Escherichia coli]KLX63937.1 hypothetical protein SK79_01220 [Escherichia coli]